MTAPAHPEPILNAIAAQPDAETDLAEAALALAALGRPGVGLSRYREHLVELVQDVASLGAGTAATERMAALTAVIADRHGYRGDTLTYDDLRNANLTHVIDRRKGLPVALGILYIHTARGQGWPATGLNFPGHFLIRIDGTGDRLNVDPFNGGRRVGAGEMRDLVKLTLGLDAELAPEHYAPVSDRDILIRLQNNIKTRHLQEGRLEEALEIIATMQILAPEAAALSYESGTVNIQLGRPAAAIASFERFIALGATGEAQYRAAALVQALRTQLN